MAENEATADGALEIDPLVHTLHKLRTYLVAHDWMPRDPEEGIQGWLHMTEEGADACLIVLDSGYRPDYAGWFARAVDLIARVQKEDPQAVLAGIGATGVVRRRLRLEEVPQDYDGCSSACYRYELNHTRKPGCALAPVQVPAISFCHVSPAADGCLSAHQVEIPFETVFPWAAHLPPEDRRAMLEEAAESDDPDACLTRWRRAPRIDEHAAKGETGAPPELVYCYVLDKEDGSRTPYVTSFPLTLFFPWASPLSGEDQRTMLVELAGADDDGQAQLLIDWRDTATVWAERPEEMQRLAAQLNEGSPDGPWRARVLKEHREGALKALEAADADRPDDRRSLAITEEDERLLNEGTQRRLAIDAADRAFGSVLDLLQDWFMWWQALGPAKLPDSLHTRTAGALTAAGVLEQDALGNLITRRAFEGALARADAAAMSDDGIDDEEGTQ